jgi:protein SCO1/2
MVNSINRLPLLLAVLLVGLFPAQVRAEATSAQYGRSVVSITVPDVVLVNQNGEKVRLKTFLSGATQPVVVDFIYGTCTTICPILSAGFANLQRKLGSDSTKVRLVSISIDPENDTPKVMKAYLERYQARPGWDFLTGSRDDINNVMEAFDAYFPDKMSHLPLNFTHKPGESTWVRLHGLMSSNDFMSECQKAGIQ